MSDCGPTDDDQGRQPAEDVRSADAASSTPGITADSDSRTTLPALATADSDSSNLSALFPLDVPVVNPEGAPTDNTVDSPDVSAVDSCDGKNTGLTAGNSEGTRANSATEGSSDSGASNRESSTAESTHTGSSPVVTAADSEKGAPAESGIADSLSVTVDNIESSSVTSSTTHLTKVTPDTCTGVPKSPPAFPSTVNSKGLECTIETGALQGPPVSDTVGEDKERFFTKSKCTSDTTLTGVRTIRSTTNLLADTQAGQPESQKVTTQVASDTDEFSPNSKGDTYGNVTVPACLHHEANQHNLGCSASVGGEDTLTEEESMNTDLRHVDDRKNNHTQSDVDTLTDQLVKLSVQSTDTGRPLTKSSPDGNSSDAGTDIIDFSSDREMGCGKSFIKIKEDSSNSKRDCFTQCITTSHSEAERTQNIEDNITGPDMPLKQKSYLVTVSNVPVLSAFRFNEHCEQVFKHRIEMSFDSSQQCVRFLSSSNCTEAVAAEADKFLKALCTATMELKQVSFKLLQGNQVVLDRLNSKLKQTDLQCHLQLDNQVLKAFARSQDDASHALKVVLDLLLIKIVDLHGCSRDEVQNSLKSFQKELKQIEKFYFVELVSMDKGYQLSVVSLNDTAVSVFKTLERHFPYGLHDHLAKSSLLECSPGSAARADDSASIGHPHSVASETRQTVQCMNDPHPPHINRGQEATETFLLYQAPGQQFPGHGTENDYTPSVDQMRSGSLCDASCNPVGHAHQSTTDKDPRTQRLLPKIAGQTASQMGGSALSVSCDQRTDQVETGRRLQHNSTVLTSFSTNTGQHTEAQREVQPKSNTSPNTRQGDDASNSHSSYTPTITPTTTPTTRLPLTISALTAEMLTDADVQKDFVVALTKVHVIVEFDALSQERLYLVVGELGALKVVLKSFLHESVIPCDRTDDMDMVRAIILSLKDKYQHQLIYQFDDAQNQYRIAFLRLHDSEINPVLQDLNTFKKHISLPMYKVKYCIRFLEVMKKECDREAQGTPFQLELSVSSDGTGRLGLLVRTDRQNRVKIMKIVHQQLTKIVVRETNIGTAKGLFFLDNQTYRLFQNIETAKQCLLSVGMPIQSTLIHAKSPEGGEVHVCSGNIAESDCQVLVIPLCEGKTRWPDLYKQILKKGFLPEEVARYLEEVGSPEQNMDRYTVTLTCNRDLTGKRVVVMFVPRIDYKKFYNYLQDACEEALKAAFLSNSSVALPLDLGDDMPAEKVWKRVLLSVTRILESSPGTHVKLLMNMQNPSAFGLCRDIEGYLVNMKWIVSSYFQQDSRVETRIRVMVGEVLDIKADVYVNSTDGELTHEKGLVSKILLDKAGEDLKVQCLKLYPEGIKDNVIARTRGFKTNFDWIFHIKLHGHWIPENGAELLQELRIRVQACLALASALGWHTIALPTLGLGTLKYPADKVAKTMFSATREFFTEMPHSSLECVFIMCYYKQSKEIQVFKVEEAHSRKHWTVGGILEVKGAQVLLVQQNLDVLDFTASITIYGPQLKGNFGDYENKAEAEGSRAIQWTSRRAKGIVKHACRQCSSDPRSVSLQINMQTFGQDCYDDIISSLTSELYHFLVVYLVVRSDTDLHKVAAQLKRATSHSKSTWNLLASVSNWNPSVSASGGSSIGTSVQQADMGSIQIIGPWASTSSVLDSVLNLTVPEEYAMKAAEFEKKMREGSSVDKKASGRSIEGVKDDINAMRDNTLEEYSSGEPDTCRFMIPVQQMKNMDIENFYQCLKNETKGMLQAYSKKGQELVFSTSMENFDHVVNLAWSMIRKHSGVKSGNNQTAAIKPQSFTFDLDSLEYEALEYLLREQFCKSVTIVSKVGGKVTLSSKGEKSSFVEKLGSLRREDVQLPAEDLARLGYQRLDTSEENLEAFIKPLPDQGKVAILAFDYNTITKAKHLVSVKAGKVKVTARARRRFDGAGQDEHSPPQSIDSSSSQSNVNSKEFSTKCGIRVLVYKTDITKLPVDGIVNAANGQLSHGGGVAYAIAKAAGMTLEEEGDAYVKKNGLLKVTEVVPTTAGAMPCKKVLHAVGPRWDDYQDKAQCQQDLEQTVFNCLVTAHDLRFSSLAVSSVSSAIFGVPRDLCALMYLSAVKSFDQQYGGRTSLHVIHFVDIIDHMVSVIQDVFTTGWDTDGMASDGNGTLYIHQGAAPTPGNSYTVSANSSSQSAQREVPLGDAHSSGQGKGCPPDRMQTNLPHTRREQSNQGDPTVTDSTSWQKYNQFSFINLNLIFQQQRVSSVHADAVVLWQYTGCVLESENSKQLMQGLRSSEVSRLRSKLTCGAVEVIKTEKKLFILPVVSPHLSTREKVFNLFKKAMNEAELLGMKTVAVSCFSSQPGSKRPRETYKDVEEYAAGIYLAVRKYTDQVNRSITQVCIIETDLQTLKTIEETVCKMSVLDKSKEDVVNNPRPQSAAHASIGSNEPLCVICQDKMTKPKTLRCGHIFCSKCIDRWMETKPVCPSCQTVLGVMTGNQPANGTMKMRHSTTVDCGHSGAYEIDYSFPGGKQTDEHPKPGRSYSKTSRKAYLPDTHEGRKVLMLLKVAFDRRLVFTVGQSTTTGQDDSVIWNDIHHKTSIDGGSYGYPDPTYLARVQGELAAKGVTSDNLTVKQKDFIQNPKKYYKFTGREFYHEFRDTNTK